MAFRSHTIAMRFNRETLTQRALVLRLFGPLKYLVISAFATSISPTHLYGKSRTTRARIAFHYSSLGVRASGQVCEPLADTAMYCHSLREHAQNAMLTS